MTTKLPSRIDVIDALRGFALLGILWINLPGHAFSPTGMSNPLVAGGSGYNVHFWTANAILVDGTMRAIFSFLFGVGAALQFAGGVSQARYYFRYFLLMILGAVHGIFLLMPGDILFAYGLTAFCLFPLRNLNARALFFIALVSAISLASLSGFIAYENITFNDTYVGTGPDLGTYNYIEVQLHNALIYLSTFVTADFPSLFLDVYVMMILGMAAARTQLFSNEPAKKLLALAGALVVAGACLRLYTTHLDFQTNFLNNHVLGAVIAELARPLLSMGYIYGFIALWRLNLLKWMAKNLIAIGRLALTNYLAQTIVTTFIFYGYGLGLFEQFNRIQLVPIIMALWIAQITWSRLWLAMFSQGPVEWLWRKISRIGTAG